MQRFIITGFLWVAFVLVGCGIKGPPVPSKALPIPAAAELSYRMDGVTVILEWGVAPGLSRQQARGAAFGVYRSRSDRSQAACENCPLVFEKVATVPFVPTDENRFSKSLALEAGYRYVFKVRMETGGQVGADSNAVRLDFPSVGSPSAVETP